MSIFDYKKLYNLFFRSVKSFTYINDTTNKALQRLGINNLRDLVFYKPVSCNIINIIPDLRKVRSGDLIQVEVILEDVLRPSSRRAPLKMQVSNETGSITLVFFNKIHPFIYSKLRVGQKYVIAGKIEIFDHMPQITHPEFIFKKEIAATPMMPVYRLTYGIVNKQLYGYIREAINLLENELAHGEFAQHKDYFDELLNEIKKLHFVNMQNTSSSFEVEKYQNSNLEELAKKELFANQASLAKIRNIAHKSRGRSFKSDHEIQKAILAKLGFELTKGQEEAIGEIELDQGADFQMMRLLQGDVGSGKTLVALVTMLNVVKSGAQAALMVPTDLLSMQHYQFFSYALENTGVKAQLLTGKTSVKQRKEIQKELLTGEISILIGTHALFQEHVEFKDLGYIIIDEQHKFGVEQRLELIKKASHPDVLVMTATPIPRSLALTAFGDMDVSKIKTKPLDRLPIITTIMSNEKKLEIINSLGKKLQAGERLYWVCPLVDQSDNSINDGTHEEGNQKNILIYSDVTSRFAELNQIYPSQVSMLHGKMKGDLKDKIMQEFKDGTIKILVATTVIEVGIDVPESSLIIIENAEKFGLAQLHQLRGRVGRGNKQSHCILMYNPKRLSNVAKERLKIMRQSDDGFYIAEQDLILRGGGEILGTKQSGAPVFFFADLAKDLKALLLAHDLVKTLQNNEFIDFQISLFARNKNELIKSG